MPVIRFVQENCFDEAARITKDEYWASILRQLAEKKAPENVYLSRGSIISIIKGSEFNYRYDNKTPRQIADEVPGLFRLFLNQYSDIDIANRKKKIRENRSAPTDFRMIKQKAMREWMIRHYTSTACRRFGIGIPQMKKMFNDIMINLKLKRLSLDDVEMSGCIIKSIQGLVLYPGGYTLTLTKSVSLSEDEDEE